MSGTFLGIDIDAMDLQRAKIWSTEGTFTWTCPAGVTAILLTGCGAGGYGSSAFNLTGYATSFAGAGGGAGAWIWRKLVPVEAGQIYTITLSRAGATLAFGVSLGKGDDGIGGIPGAGGVSNNTDAFIGGTGANGGGTSAAGGGGGGLFSNGSGPSPSATVYVNYPGGGGGGIHAAPPVLGTTAIVAQGAKKDTTGKLFCGAIPMVLNGSGGMPLLYNAGQPGGDGGGGSGGFPVDGKRTGGTGGRGGGGGGDAGLPSMPANTPGTRSARGGDPMILIEY